MKAEHRKELQTNILADRLGKFIQNVKARPSTTAIIVWGFVVLALVLFVTWWFFSRGAARDQSHQWIQLDKATSIENLERIIKESPGTPPARAAQFKVARDLLSDGQAHLYLKGRRDDALTELKDARDRYARLAKESSNEPLLVQEALMNAGSIDIMLGDRDEALMSLKALVKRYPKTYQGRRAADLVAEMENDADGLERLQKALSQKAGDKGSTGG